MEATFSVYRKMGAAPAVAVHGQVATKPHIVELMLDLAGYHGEASAFGRFACRLLSSTEGAAFNSPRAQPWEGGAQRRPKPQGGRNRNCRNACLALSG